MFKKLILGVLLSIVGTMIPALATTDRSPTQTYCTVPNDIANGDSLDATPVMGNYDFLASGGDYGDLFNDGPLFNPSFNYTISSLSITLPTDTWVVNGCRVYTISQPETLTANATNYLWVDTYGIWRTTTTDTAPTGISVLEYQVVTGNNGVSSVTYPPYATPLFGQGLITGQITGNGGQVVIQEQGTTQIVLENTSGSPVAQFNDNGSGSLAGGNITWTPSGGLTYSSLSLASPLPTGSGGTGTTTPALIAGTNIGVTGSWPGQTIAFSGILPIASGGTGTSSPGEIAGTNVSLSGSFPAKTINIVNAPSFSGNVITQASFIGSTLVAYSSSPLALNSNSGSVGYVEINYSNSGNNLGLRVYDGGTSNYTNILGTSITTGSLTLSTTPLAVAYGGTGTASPALIAGTNIGVTGSFPNQTVAFSGILPVPNGGTGTASPGMVAGSGINVTGSFPTQTVAIIGSTVYLTGINDWSGTNYYTGAINLQASSAFNIQPNATATSGANYGSATSLELQSSTWISGSAVTEKWDIETSGGDNLELLYNSTLEDIFGTNGTLSIGSSSYGASSETVSGTIQGTTITATTQFSGSGAGLTSGSIPIASLAANTISGISLGNNLGTLTISTHLTGTSYNGSGNVTIATDATNANTASTIVARDSSGNFNAGTITATLNGNITTSDNTSSNVTYYPLFGTGYSGAYAVETSSTKLTYNPSTGVLSATQFTGSGAGLTNGSIPIVALASDTISGIALGGTLGTLTIGTYLTGTSYNGSTGITIATDATSANTASTLVARDSSGNFSAGTVTAVLNGSVTTADVTTNATYYPLLGTGYGGAYAVDTTHGSLMFNPSTGVLSATGFSGSGADFTTASIINSELANSTISGIALGGTLYSLTPGTHLSGGAYNGSGAITLATDATNSNIASTIVARDSSGNFSAGTVTATLNGSVTTADITTNATYYPVFSLGYGGAYALDTSHSALSFNPSTGTITATTFSGAISGSGAGLTNGSVPIAALAADTISGIPLGNSLDTLTFGTHLAAGGSSYNGGSAVTISTDATNADTVSTIVARDSSGNIIVSGITASTSGLTSGSSTYGPTSTTVNGNIILNSTSVIEFGTSSNNLYLEVPGSGTTVSGVGCSLLGIAKATTPTYEACFDTSGDFGVGNIYDAGLTSGDLAGVTTNGELTNITVGHGLTDSSGNLSVSGCANTTCQKSINSPLCFISGAVTTGTAGQQCPGWVPENLSSASINTLTAYCQTADNGTTVFTIYQNGSSFSTITLGTSNVTTKSVSLTLTNGDTYTAAITTAGTGAYCSLLMSGLENVQ